MFELDVNTINSSHWNDAKKFYTYIFHPDSFDMETTKMVYKVYCLKKAEGYVDFLYNLADYIIILAGLSGIDDYCKGFVERTLPTLNTYIKNKDLTILAVNNYLLKRMEYLKTLNKSELSNIFKIR